MARLCEIETALSLKQQSAYGTILPNTALVENFPWEGSGFIKGDPKDEDDSKMNGKGHEFAEGDTITLTMDVKFSRKYYGASKFIGWVAGFGLGSVTTTTLAPGVYKHVFVPFNTRLFLELPCTSIAEKITDFRSRVYRDLVVTEFKISGELEKQLVIDFSMQGSGWWEECTLLTFPELSEVSWLYTSDVSFNYGGTEINSKLSDFEFSWKNNINEKSGRPPGSPKMIFDNKKYQCRGNCRLKNREIGLKWKMAMHDNSIETDMLKKLVKTVTISCQGEAIDETHFHSAELKFPRVELAKATETDEDGEFYYDIEARVKYDRVTNTPVIITVINDVPAYLTPAT